ncbi:MAG: hypothetical protein IMW98_02670 [Firmicutes bacterium]|nr:hypothetical protein [Bacillota bacterium]
MKLLSLRRPAVRAALLFLACLAAAAVLFHPVRVESYEARILARLPWGPEGVTAAGPEGGRRLGPRSFAVAADGTLYIADTLAGRILVLSPDGRSLRALVPHGRGGAAVHVDDLAPAPDGRLFVADHAARAVWEVAPDGQAVPYYEVEAGEVRGWAVQGLAVDAEGRPVVDAVRLTPSSYEREIRRLEQDAAGTVLAKQIVDERGARVDGGRAVLPDSVESLGLGNDGRLYALSPEGSAFTRLIHVFGADGRPLRALRVQTEAELRQSQILGLDRWGGLYVGLNLGSPDGRIVKIDGRGRAVWSAPAPAAPDQPALGAYARVDRDGNLYVLNPGAEGLEVQKWVRHARWTLRLR